MENAKKEENKIPVCVVSEDALLRNSLVYFLSLHAAIAAKGVSRNEAEQLKDFSLIYCVNAFQEEQVQFIRKRKLVSNSPLLVVATVTEDPNAIIQLMKSGADDLILQQDGFQNKVLSAVLHQVNARPSLETTTNFSVSSLIPLKELKRKFIGESESVQAIFELIGKAAGSSINVLITGETGTGKELVAQSIHQFSARQRQSLVTVNMAAIPRDLAESELFGHEKGAFTGAVQQRVGKFEQAGKGSLFLDEVGEMDLNLQAKLLRVLQERELVRVGGTRTIPVQCRIIAATNRDLQEEVRKGNFREDLFYRLFGLTIELPPLRKRGRDVLLLARHLMDSFCRENNLLLPVFSQEAEKKILQHSFPGNIRELKACIELAVVFCNGKTIEEKDIRLQDNFSIQSLLMKEKTLQEYEKEIVKHFLGKNDGNVVLTAEKLGIGKSTIYRMLKEDEVFFNGV